MSITCQISRQAPNKLRLDAPGIATQPETSQWLMQRLLAVPGVAGVELLPTGESAIIRYDGTAASRVAILRALRSDVQADAQHPNANEQPTPTPISSPSTPFASCEVVHAMRGRIRLHLPRSGNDATLCGVLAHFLGEQSGVRHVRINRYAATAVVVFDPVLLDAQAIVSMVATYAPDAAAVARWCAAQHDQAQPSSQHAHQRQLETILAVAALALTLFAGAWATWLVYALLLGCAGSILQRTYKSLHSDRKPRLEAVEAVAMVLVGLTGSLWAAACVPLAARSLSYLRIWVQVNATQTPVKTRPHPQSSSAQHMPRRAFARLPEPISFFGLDLRKTGAMPATSAPSEHVTPQTAALLRMDVTEAEPALDVAASLWSTASIGSTTWFVYADSFEVAPKVDE